MQNSKTVIGRPSKHIKLRNGLGNYLVAARTNQSLKLSILAISKAIGVKKSTIYQYQQHDPEVAELLNSIRALATARRLAALNRDEFVNFEDEEKDQTSRETSTDLKVDDGESISLELLTIRSANAVQTAVWSMNKFIGRHRKHQFVSDLPRVVFDLDSTVAELYRIRGELSILSDEWIHSSQNNSEIVSIGDQLSLSYMPDEQS